MRPETVTAAKDTPCPDTFDSYWMIRDAVERRDLLIYGRLDDAYGNHCAIGSYFDDNPKTALRTEIVDEVAAYNDSIPKAVAPTERKRKVLEWLNAKIAFLQKRGPARA